MAPGARRGPTTARLLASQLGWSDVHSLRRRTRPALEGLLDLAKAIPFKSARLSVKRAPSRSKCWERIGTSPSQWLRLTFDVGERRPGLVHDETIFVCGDRLCRSGVPGLSAGCQGFCRYDRHRGYGLRSLAIYERAYFGGNRLDLRFLDRTQLRSSGEWSITGDNQYVGDSGRSRKNMRSANIANISQRRMDHLSWV